MGKARRWMPTTVAGLLPVLVVSAAPVAAAADLRSAPGTGATTVAASAVGELDAFLRRDSATFGGLVTDGATRTATVTVAGEPGMADARAAVTEFTRVRTTAIQTEAEPAWRVSYRVVPRSLADLQRVKAQVKTAEPWSSAARAAATTGRTAVTQYYVDTERNVVVVGVEQVTEALTAAARQTFGDDVVLHQADRLDQAFSRIDDWPSHLGGAEIITGNRLCTSGFSVLVGNVSHFVTAGHCAARAGETARNNNRVYGTFAEREDANGGMDVALVQSEGDTFGIIYNGPRTSNSVARVAGRTTRAGGQTVCQSGAVTAEICNGVVDFVDTCAEFRNGIETCGLNGVASTDGRRLMAGGDSGAPVYIYNAPEPGQNLLPVAAVGMVVGGTSDGTFYVYHPINTVLNRFGAVLSIGPRS